MSMPMNKTTAPMKTILTRKYNGKYGTALAGSTEIDAVCGRPVQIWADFDTAEEAAAQLGGLIRLYSKSGMVMVEDVDARRARLDAERRRNWARAKYGR